jgi:DNA-binding response OmpR family regulator
MKKKVLFVDDEPDMTRMLKIALEGIGLTIDTFNDPLQALKSFKPNLYGLEGKTRIGRYHKILLMVTV